MKLQAIALGALCAASLSAQVFEAVVDDFSEGDFVLTGTSPAQPSKQINQSIPEVIGGVRLTTLFQGNAPENAVYAGTSASVTGGQFAFVDNDNQIVSLKYGFYDNRANLMVDVGTISLTASAASGATVVFKPNGTTAGSFVFTEPGIQTLTFNPPIRAGILDFWFTEGSIAVDEIRVTTPVPEPADYALITACGLLAIAFLRKRS